MLNFGLTGTRVLDPERGVDQVKAIGWQNSQLIEGKLLDLPITEGGGWVSGPGLIDLYAHSGEPGNEQRETLESLAKAARAGGFIAVTLLPNTDPVLDHASPLRAMRQRLPKDIQWQLLGTMTLGSHGKSPVEAAEMAPWVVGFGDGVPPQDWQQLRNFLEYVRPLERPVFIYPRHNALHQGVAVESALALALGLKMIPPVAETAALDMVTELVKLTGTPVHLMRLATAGGVERLRRAKAEGLPITGSVTCYQLLLTEAALVSLDPQLRFDPPLGRQEDWAALIGGLQDGTLDAIASDHTPWTYAEKTLPFTQTPPGAIALELALPLLWSHLVVPGHLEALTLWRALTVGPARVLGWDRLPLSWIAFDPQTVWKVDHTTIHSLSQATPWWGKTITGKVCRVWTE